MKIVIDIDEEVKGLVDGKKATMNIDLYSELIQYIKNSTLLEKVFDDIRAEIKEHIIDEPAPNGTNAEMACYNSGLLLTLEIIDKNIKGNENKKEDIFPTEGQAIKMFVNGEWKYGKVIKGYRYKDGIVTMETDSGEHFWCGQDRTDIYKHISGKETE